VSKVSRWYNLATPRASMDKTRKLRRYRRKDYTQVVDFPVEIIGRDGVVRRYSFEESVRLYQRRIASADLRYKDSEVTLAEQAHCQQRIEQLRRSFFARFGWPEIGLVDGLEETDGRISGEVAAFLLRCLSGEYADLSTFCITPLDERDHYRAYHLQAPLSVDETSQHEPGRFLLYVYRFEQAATCTSRDAFFDYVKVLEGLKMSSTNDVELLIAFHHTGDCGLILTGTRDVVPIIDKEALIDALDLSWADGKPPRAALLSEGMGLLRRGLHAEALERFVIAYSRQHYNRLAYVAAAALANLLGHDDEAETAAIMGTRYFPGDPALGFHLALAHLRRGEFARSRTILEDLRDCSAGSGARRLLEGITLLYTDRPNAGRRLIQSIDPKRLGAETHLDHARTVLLAQLRARATIRQVSTFTIVSGIVMSMWWLSHSSPGLAAVGVGVCALGILVNIGIHRAWRRQLHAMLNGPKDRRLCLTDLSALQWGQGEKPPQ
jgi:hypothetical protein